MMDVPKNRYLANGHNYQDDRLPIYLPGNGGLLAATAMMAAGGTVRPIVMPPVFPTTASGKSAGKICTSCREQVCVRSRFFRNRHLFHLVALLDGVDDLLAITQHTAED